jgi:hypothetical protein
MVTAHSQPSGKSVTYAKASRSCRSQQCLSIGVYRDEADPRDILFNHAIDSVIATTAHANDLDLGKILNSTLNCLSPTF